MKEIIHFIFTWPELWKYYWHSPIDNIYFWRLFYRQLRYNALTDDHYRQNKNIYILKCWEVNGLLSIVFINAFLVFDCTVCSFCTLSDFVFYINKRKILCITDNEITCLEIEWNLLQNDTDCLESHRLFTNGRSAVNGCRQNESLIKTS